MISKNPLECVFDSIINDIVDSVRFLPDDTDFSLNNLSKLSEYLRISLFERTLSLVADIDFYKNRIEFSKIKALIKKDECINCILDQIKLTYKNDIINHWHDLINKNVKIIGFKMTSGTIKRVILPVSLEEILSLSAIHYLRSTVHKNPISNPKEVNIRIIGNYIFPTITTIDVITIPFASNRYDIDRIWFMSSSNELIYLLSLLKKNEYFSLNYISTFPSYLRRLTFNLYKYGIDPSSLGFKKIYLTGGYITKHFRETMEKIWKAKIINIYSMTEINNVATEDNNNELLCFDDFSLVEAIDKRGRPVMDKPGIIVQTSLYPFQQAMPLIRYYTGDVAILTELSNGNICINKYIGREEYLIDLSDVLRETSNGYRVDYPYISYIDIYEILDKYSEFSGYEPPRFFIEEYVKTYKRIISISVAPIIHLSNNERTMLRRKILEEVYAIYPWLDDNKVQKKIKIKLNILGENSISKFYRRL